MPSTIHNAPISPRSVTITFSVATNSVHKSGKRKHISFASVEAEVVGHVLARGDFTRTELVNYWYTRHEYVSMKTYSRAAIITTRRHHPELAALVDASYRTAQDVVTRADHCKDSHEIINILDEPDLYTLKLQEWSLQGNDRRGLEKATTNHVLGSRLKQAREARYLVLETQFSLCGEQVGAQYATDTRLSRLYARMMGHADQQVVKRLENEPSLTNKSKNVAPTPLTTYTSTTNPRTCMFLREPRLSTV